MWRSNTASACFFFKAKCFNFYLQIIFYLSLELRGIEDSTAFSFGIWKPLHTLCCNKKIYIGSTHALFSCLRHSLFLSLSPPCTDYFIYVAQHKKSLCFMRAVFLLSRIKRSRRLCDVYKKASACMRWHININLSCVHSKWSKCKIYVYFCFLPRYRGSYVVILS